MAELAHGFTDINEWHAFFDTYFQHIERMDHSFAIRNKKHESFDTWIRAYRKTSQQIHAKYLENDHYLDRHIYYFIRDKQSLTTGALTS